MYDGMKYIFSKQKFMFEFLQQKDKRKYIADCSF